MNLRIVPKGLEMSDALDGRCDGFPVYNAALPEGNRHAEALSDLVFQDFHLHFAHDLRADLRGGFLPDNRKLRFLFL